MKHPLRLFLLAGLATGLFAKDLPLANPGFEDGLEGWIVAPGDTHSAASPDAARFSSRGRLGLQVDDQDEKTGSGVSSIWFPVEAGKTYAVDFWARVRSGSGVAVYLRFRDAKHKTLASALSGNELLLTIPADTADWRPFNLSSAAPEGAAFVSIWIHSFSKNKVLAQFDDFALTVAE